MTTRGVQLEISLGPSEREMHVQALNEGLWDSVRDGLRVLVDKVTEAFKGKVSEWYAEITRVLSKKLPSEFRTVAQAIVEGTRETGEQIPWDEDLRTAMELSKIDRQTVMDAVQMDIEGPVREKAGSVTEGKYLSGLYVLMCEESPYGRATRLDESVSLVTAVGFAMASLAGVPMVLNGLRKLAVYLNAQRTAELLGKAYKVAHKFEENVIDFVVPDALSWYVYQRLMKQGIRMSSKKLVREEFVSNKDHAKSKVEGLMYKTLLIYPAYTAICSILEGGASLLTFVEGSATAVKGIEFVEAATVIATIIKKG